MSINTLFFLCDMIQAYRVTQHKCDKLERNGKYVTLYRIVAFFLLDLKMYSLIGL